MRPARVEELLSGKPVRWEETNGEYGIRVSLGCDDAVKVFSFEFSRSG
jgi:hypothetical protein